ncbi:MAG: hypothetical protein ACREKE_09165 [bacterium]
MASTPCTDRTVNSILAGWRYDISGISPEMRKDYERHLAECAHCASRQRFHRRLDLSLAALTGLLFAFFSLFSLALLCKVQAVRRAALALLRLVDAGALSPLLLILALTGAVLSVVAFALVLAATPTPGYLGSLAAERVRKLEEHLPEAMRPFRPR